MYCLCTVSYALLTSEQVVGEGSGGRLNELSENLKSRDKAPSDRMEVRREGE